MRLVDEELRVREGVNCGIWENGMSALIHLRTSALEGTILAKESVTSPVTSTGLEKSRSFLIVFIYLCKSWVSNSVGMNVYG